MQRQPRNINPTKWLAPSREWLVHQHLELGKTLAQIADEVGAQKRTVHRWAKNLDVYSSLTKPTKVGNGSGARFYGVTPEWLHHEYLEAGKSANQIANEVGTSPLAVMKWLRKHNIPVRSDEELRARHSQRMSGVGNPAYKDGSSITYHKRKALKHYPRRCMWCGTTKRLQVHHRDHDRTNGELDNLALLCGTCNRLEAHLWALRQKGRADIRIDEQERKIEIRFF